MSFVDSCSFANDRFNFVVRFETSFAEYVEMSGLLCALCTLHKVQCRGSGSDTLLAVDCDAGSQEIYIMTQVLLSKPAVRVKTVA